MDGYFVVVDCAEAVDLHRGPGQVDLVVSSGRVGECDAGADILSCQVRWSILQLTSHLHLNQSQLSTVYH